MLKFVVSAIAAAAMFAFVAVAPAETPAFVNWPRYLFSNQHSSDNGAAESVTPANAARLSQAWRFSPPGGPQNLNGFWSSPTVYNGVVYIGARNGRFYALSETTGKVVWSRFVGYVTAKTCSAAGFTSTAAVSPDPTSGKPTVYVYGATGYLYAMDAATGANVWPPAKVAVPSKRVNNYTPGIRRCVAHGNIYVGISSQCNEPGVRAGVDSFSQATGKHQHTFWTDTPGGKDASVW